MSGHKHCVWCGGRFSRAAGIMDHIWNVREFCSRSCKNKSWQERNPASSESCPSNDAVASDMLNRACWALYDRTAKARRLKSPLEAAVMMGMAA